MEVIYKNIKKLLIILICIMLVACNDINNTNNNNINTNTKFKRIEHTNSNNNIDYNKNSITDNSLSIMMQKSEDKFSSTSDNHFISSNNTSHYVIETNENINELMNDDDIKFIYNIDTDVDIYDENTEIPTQIYDELQLNMIDEIEAIYCYNALEKYLKNIDSMDLIQDIKSSKTYGKDVTNILIWNVNNTLYKCIITNSNIFITDKI